MSSSNTIKHYLLGMLDAEEQQRIEEHLISDRDFFEQVMIVEDELIDEFLDGSLSEKERFVTHFLASPEQRRKLKRVQAIKRFIDELETTESVQPVRYSKRLAFWRRAFAASL